MDIRAIGLRAALAVTLCAIAGCATSPRDSSPGGVRAELVATARELVGTPYRWGGETPAGMDCSGLVHYVYASSGIAVPRTTTDQLRHGRGRDRALPGDLLFFRIDGRKPSHVGIYAGGGRMVHASSGARRVRLVEVDAPYWRRRLVTAVSYLD